MPPLIPTYIISFIFGGTTLLCIFMYLRNRDYTALALLPGTFMLAVIYVLVDFLPMNVARAWVRWSLLGLGIQIVILLVWKYFILGTRK